MATQRYISTSFWDDAWVQSLSPDEKLFYIYLLTNPLTNIAGVYQITDRRISFDIGFSEETIVKMWSRFDAGGKAVRIGEWVVIPSWPKHQRWEKSQKIQSGIESILKNLPTSVFKTLENIGYQYPIDRVSIPQAYPSNYIDTDTDTDIDSESSTPPPKSEKVKHPSLGVPLGKAQYERLIAEYGKSTVEEYIRKIDNYVKSKGRKPYKDYAAAAENWMQRDKVEKIGKELVREERLTGQERLNNLWREYKAKGEKVPDELIEECNREELAKYGVEA